MEGEDAAPFWCNGRTESRYPTVYRSRTFTASNGREYKWKMGWWTPTLVLNDGTDTPVVKFHRKLYTFVKKKGEPSLEIFPDLGTENILDEVIMTFVYVETIRKRRERAARY
jgi:hypothetical protein